MVRTINNGGTDVHITERPRDNGWVIRQGHSHILVTDDEATQLAQALNDAVTEKHSPGRAHILRYPAG